MNSRTGPFRTVLSQRRAPVCRSHTRSLKRWLLTLSLLLTAPLLLAGAAAAQCTLNTASPSVTICTPANGATVTSPVSVVAGTTDNAHPVTAMKVYLDNTAVYTVHTNQLSTTLTMGSGKHNVTVNAWDSSGAVFKSTSIITVSGTGTGPVSVAVSPHSQTLSPGQTQQFSATVLNTTNTGVNWYVDNSLLGNTTSGTITTGGLYTAGTALGPHNVTAVSLADKTKSDTAVVTVQAPAVTVSINPPSASVAPGGTVPFTATVQNASNTNVTWSVNGTTGGSSTTGTITTGGVYTAPSGTGSFTVTATSVADSSKSASANVNVTSSTGGFPSSNHVFLVMDENQSYSEVFPSGTATLSNCSSSTMPYLCGLAAKYGMATNFYSNRHDSLLLYLYATSASTWTSSPTNCNGLTCASIGAITGDNLMRQLNNNGKTWRGYFEDMPSQGYMGGDTGNYLLHHNPFPWYSYVANSVTQQDNMYPFSSFNGHINSGNFANFTYIVPNSHNDADEGSGNASAILATADTWLQKNIDPLLKTTPFQPGGDGILIVTFDEGRVAGKSGDNSTDNSCSPTQSSGCGGHIVYVMIGPNVKPASTTTNTYHFQDMVHTMIHLLGLPTYINGASSGTDINLLPGVP